MFLPRPALLLVLCVCGCRSEAEREQQEDERGYAQQGQAHLLVSYDSDSEIRVYQRLTPKVVLVTLSALRNHVAGLSGLKDLAVVTLGKPAYPWTEGKLDEIERLLKGAGVTRVIFHAASAEGVSIVRE